MTFQNITKTLLITLTFLLSIQITSAASLPLRFATGLPDYTAAEEQEILGQEAFPDDAFTLPEETIADTPPVLALSAGHVAEDFSLTPAPSAAARSATRALPKSVTLTMGPTKDQGRLNSCAAFALVAAVEQVTGKQFSAIEFYFRALGHFDANPEMGSKVSDYISVLHQGLVEAEHFPSEADTLRFLETFRDKSKWYNHRNFVTRLVAWCKANGKSVPEEVYPKWVEVEEVVPILGTATYMKPKGLWLPFASKDTPPDCYDYEEYWADRCYRGGCFSRGWLNVFNIAPANTRDSRENLFAGKLIRLKSMLEKMPVVLSIYLLDDNHWFKYDRHTISETLRHTVDIPEERPIYSEASDPAELRRFKGFPNYWSTTSSFSTAIERLRSACTRAGWSADAIAKRIAQFKEKNRQSAHAVCLHGYDDTTQTFLVRNSWGMWGNAGTIHLTYRYVERFAFDASVIIPSETERITPTTRTATKRDELFDDFRTART